MEESKVLSIETKRVINLLVDFNHELMGYLNNNQFAIIKGKYIEQEMTVHYYTEDKNSFSVKSSNIIEENEIRVAIKTREYEAKVKEYWKWKKAYSRDTGGFAGVGYYDFEEHVREWGTTSEYAGVDENDNVIKEKYEIVLGKKMYVEIEHG